MGILSTMKSLADRMNFPIGVTGESYRGILIVEENRMSKFVGANDREELDNLRSVLHNKYRRKNIKAVIFGIHTLDEGIKYAIYINASKAAERDKTSGYQRRFYNLQIVPASLQTVA